VEENGSRAKDDVYTEILQSSLSDTNGTTFLKLMYDSFLSYRQLSEDLEGLVRCGLLVNQPDITHYKITKKGRRLLKLIEEMNTLLSITHE
jgi:predicted transcriptional regulator